MPVRRWERSWRFNRLRHACVITTLLRTSAEVCGLRGALPARRITVNRAHANLPKESSHYDLSIAPGLMAASGAIPADALGGSTVLDELALGCGQRNGRPVPAAERAARTPSRAAGHPTTENPALEVPRRGSNPRGLSRNGEMPEGQSASEPRPCLMLAIGVSGTASKNPDSAPSADAWHSSSFGRG